MNRPGNTRALERQLGDWMRARLPHSAAELVMFALKQGWACLFGGLLLIALIATSALWQDDWPIARYDALFLLALGLQATFLAFRLETWNEAKVIALFHITGTVMEIFKVQAGSWAYPGDGLIKLWDVPLFSGFMYASVGSYIARAIRLFELRYTPYPPPWVGWVLGAAIYVNFFTHHFLPDVRLALIAATVVIFARTRVRFTVGGTYWMPMPLSALLVAFFLWLAENIGTATSTWLYTGQRQGEMVGLAKLGSWYLLLYVSFVTVTVVMRDALDVRGFRRVGPRAKRRDLQPEGRR